VLQLLAIVESTPADHGFGDQSIPALYLIELGTVSGGEVEMEALPFFGFSQRATAALLWVL
jgi:hypothetical protein